MVAPHPTHAHRRVGDSAGSSIGPPLAPEDTTRLTAAVAMPRRGMAAPRRAPWAGCTTCEAPTDRAANAMADGQLSCRQWCGAIYRVGSSVGDFSHCRHGALLRVLGWSD